MSVDPLLSIVPHSVLLELARTPHLWNIDGINISSEATTIAGWCLPIDGRLNNSALLVNGQLFPINHRRFNGEFSRLYPWYPFAGYSGFDLVIPHVSLDLRQARELEFECCRVDGIRNPDAYRLAVTVEDLSFKLPPAEIARRIGAEHLLHYTMFGRSIYSELRRALMELVKSELGSFETIVDWGCGSGRVGRHFLSELTSTQTYRGFDIDQAAVDWANSRFGAHFATCSLNPPMQIDAGSTDLAFAYSVLTHLPEPALSTWVAEIKRILRPGGIFAFTILGDGSIVALQPAQSVEYVARWRQTGISDDVQNSQLETIGVGTDYYRNIWLTRDYVRRVLGGFEILAFKPNFHFYQDLVLARRLPDS